MHYQHLRIWLSTFTFDYYSSSIYAWTQRTVILHRFMANGHAFSTCYFWVKWNCSQNCIERCSFRPWDVISDYSSTIIDIRLSFQCASSSHFCIYNISIARYRYSIQLYYSEHIATGYVCTWITRLFPYGMVSVAPYLRFKVEIYSKSTLFFL